jgi:hypothetical protein
MCDAYETQKYTLWTKRKTFRTLKQVVYTAITCFKALILRAQHHTTQLPRTSFTDSPALKPESSKQPRSTVTLRVVGGDEKGSLKCETVKYGREMQGARTKERLRWQGPAAYIKVRPVLSSERATHKKKKKHRNGLDIQQIYGHGSHRGRMPGVTVPADCRQ